MAETFNTRSCLSGTLTHLHLCPCEKCKAKREADKAANRETTDLDMISGGAMMCGSMKEIAKQIKQEVEKEAAEEAAKLSPGEALFVYLGEGLSITAIGIAYVAIIWVYIAQYAYGFFLGVYHSDRKTQALVVFIFSYIVISAAVTYYQETYRIRKLKDMAYNKTVVNETTVIAKNANVVKETHKSHKSGPKNTTKIEKSKSRNNAGSEVAQTKEINLIPKPENQSDQSKSDERKPSFLEKIFGCCPKSLAANSTNTKISDEQAREIFRQSKLFAIPTEMRQPPAILVYLQELLSNN